MTGRWGAGGRREPCALDGGSARSSCTAGMALAGGSPRRPSRAAAPRSGPQRRQPGSHAGFLGAVGQRVLGSSGGARGLLRRELGDRCPARILTPGLAGLTLLVLKS